MSDTERIELGEFDVERFGGQWVEIKRHRTLGDTKQIEMAGITLGATELVDREIHATIESLDITEQEIAPLLVSIVAWSLRNEDSQPLEVNRENVLDLHNDLAEWLLEQIAAHYASQERTAEQGKTSAGASTAPSLPVESSAS